MDFMELASQRFSVRSFSDKPLEQEKIDLILKAAQLAAADCDHNGTIDDDDVALLEQCGLLRAQVDQTPSL